MSDDLELVHFMTTELGDDLIVSFFVAKSQDPSDGRSIILMRDMKWEYLLAESERGVRISDEDFPEYEDAEDNDLEGIRIDNTVAEIETKHRRYRLDLRHVDESDLRAAKRILKKMNYDRRFQLTIG
ncbi:MAG: hypothetical protein ACR2QH_00675 [Geminicoccaceae bacterium]|jgi:hypothetical protein